MLPMFKEPRPGAVRRERSMEQGLGTVWVVLIRASVALFAGFVVFVLLVPTSGAEPPLCFAVLGYQVPCGGDVAKAAGVAVVALVALALWLRGLRTAT
jgi:hypothetical protein